MEIRKEHSINIYGDIDNGIAAYAEDGNIFIVTSDFIQELYGSDTPHNREQVAKLIDYTMSQWEQEGR